MKVAWPVVVILGLLATAMHARAGDLLMLDAYLDQVRENHGGYKGQRESKKGAALHAETADFSLSPFVVGNATYTSDGKISPSSLGSADSSQTLSAYAGVSKTWSFGLQSSITYSVLGISYTNPTSVTIPGLGTIGASNYANASPTLTLTQPLWGNGFGRSTRATVDLQEASAHMQGDLADFQMRNTIYQAQLVYGRLALARTLSAIYKESLDRAQKLYDWNLKRVQSNLADRSDALQSEAILQLRTLEYHGSVDELRAASVAFNSFRGRQDATVAEELQSVDPAKVEEAPAPTRQGDRSDVKAASNQAAITEANATITTEREKPTLNVTASYALNGQVGSTAPTTISTAMSNSFTTGRPTWSVGTALSIPIDQGLVSKSYKGWEHDRTGARLNYERKKWEADREWDELVQKFAEAKERLKIAHKLEGIQSAKLERERERLRVGRSTTFTILQYETDLLTAQSSRVREVFNVLILRFQMQTLYGDQS